MSLGIRTSFCLVSDKALLGASGFKEQASASSVSNNTSVAEYDRLYELKKEYYFIDLNHYAYNANKLSILRRMPHLRKEIIGFMNENNTSFDSEHDLKQLVSYCNQLIIQ